MIERRFEVIDDPGDVVGKLLRTWSELIEYQQQSGKPRSQAHIEWRQQNPGNNIPPSFIRACLDYGRPVIRNMEGFRFQANVLRVYRLGNVTLSADKTYHREPRRLELREDGLFVLQFFGQDRIRPHGKPADRSNENIKELRKQDPNLDYLVVSEGFNGEETWRKKAALDSLQESGNLTAEDLHNVGFKTTRYHKHDLVSTGDAELVNNWHPALQSILRANPKPKGYKFILSESQFSSRDYNELSMPDSAWDVENAGKVGSQSFQSQLYRALHTSSARSFLA